MAALRQKKNGIYFIDYRVNGRRLRKHVGISKKEAEIALKEIELKLVKNEVNPDTAEQQDIPLQQLVDEFKSYSKTNHAPSSQKRYKAILDHFKAFLKHYPYITRISHLSAKAFEDYKTLRKNQGAENRTINLELGLFRTMFNLAINWDYMRDNPIKKVRMLKIDNHKKPRFLSKEECRLLLDNCGGELYPIFCTFLNTGMRKSELENLEWQDVDFDRRKIKIRVKDNWRPKTTERKIPINDGLLDLLKKHYEQKQVNGWVFHRKDNSKIEPNWLRKQLMQITKKCGMSDITKIHSLRHTFASWLVMNGVDLATVKTLLGHSNIATTMIYAHLADEHIDNAVQKIRIFND